MFFVIYCVMAYGMFVFLFCKCVCVLVSVFVCCACDLLCMVCEQFRVFFASVVVCYVCVFCELLCDGGSFVMCAGLSDFCVCVISLY